MQGRLVQYAGRLIRADDGKTSVRVYDYADLAVPVLRAMHMRCLKTYKALGFHGPLPRRVSADSSTTVAPTHCHRPSIEKP